MTAAVALTVARMHGVLVTRIGSPVFHIYSGPLTPSGRWVPRAARAACNARTRRLSLIPRTGVTVDLGGRRMCARCSARLSAVARRAEQPVSREQRLTAYAEVTLGDLAVATAIAGSSDQTHGIAHVASLIHGPMHPSTTRRPAELSKRQARYDLEVEILRRRAELVAAERTSDEIHAARTRREMQADEAERARVAQKKAYQTAAAQDRAAAGKYVAPWERPLVSNA